MHVTCFGSNVATQYWPTVEYTATFTLCVACTCHPSHTVLANSSVHCLQHLHSVCWMCMLHVLGPIEPHSISQPFGTLQHLHCVRYMTWGKSRQTINITGKYSELQSSCSGCAVWRPVPLVTCPQLNDPSMQQQFIMSHQNRRETACTSRWPAELQTKRRKHQVRIMLYWNWDSSKPSELLMTNIVQMMSTEDALTCYTMVTDEKFMHSWWMNIRPCTDSQIQSTLLFLHNCLNWVNLVEFATHPTSYAHLFWYFHSLSSLC